MTIEEVERLMRERGGAELSIKENREQWFVDLRDARGRLISASSSPNGLLDALELALRPNELTTFEKGGSGGF